MCAVVVRSAARWGSFEDLPERLATAGYEVVDEDELGRRLYVKPTAIPPDRPTPHCVGSGSAGRPQLRGA